jgi:Abortive infection C-terminus
VALLIHQIVASGGFRPESPNYVGMDAIESARAAFLVEGFDLSPDGELQRRLLASMHDPRTPVALRAYVRRAARGGEDAALVTGTGKDLLEATAAYVMVQWRGTYDEQASFPALLALAFMELGLAAPQTAGFAGEPAWLDVERRLYEAACAANLLRNKQGTGHGRPFLPTVSLDQAKAAIQLMAMVSEPC